jgi:hypothetical protein
VGLTARRDIGLLQTRQAHRQRLHRSIQQPLPSGMSECSLVHEPCRRPEKIGGLAQVLQRRTPTSGDRPTDADYVAESLWRSQPAIVKEPENSTRRRSKVRPHCKLEQTLLMNEGKLGSRWKGMAPIHDRIQSDNSNATQVNEHMPADKIDALMLIYY